MERNRDHIEANRLLEALTERELTQAEWDRLDMLAVQDPFLADAIEGLKSLPVSSRRNHLVSLRNRISSNRGGTRRPVVWLQLAGVAAMVAIAAGLFWLLPDAKSNREAATVNTETSAGIERTEMLRDQPVFSQAEPEQALSDDPSPSPAGSVRNESVIMSAREQPKEPEPPRSLIQTESTMGADDGEIGASNSTEEAASTAVAAGKSESPASADQVAPLMKATVPLVQGVVLDAGGRPVTGAQIQVKGTTMESTTDMTGNFAVLVPEHQLSNALVISHGGYRTVEADVSEGDSVVVRLPSLLAGEDISVLTYTAPKHQSHMPSTRALARPVAGERAFQKYVRENLEYPERAAEQDIHGIVILEFDLDAQGTPTDFRVLQSLGFGCDEEAIRLIREGPKWDVTSAQVPIGRWEVKF